MDKSASISVESFTRRYDIDWLRVFITFLLFPFHVAKVFDVLPFYQIKNNELSGYIDYFTGFVHQGHMPLFFLLAGWSLRSSRASRGTSELIKERISRIIVPFIMGCIILCPPMQYVYAREFLGYRGGYFDFLPLFFTSLRYFSWSHLWFLIYLFTFTIIYWPLFSLISKLEIQREIKKLYVYLPAALFVIIQFFLRERWPGFQNLYDDWGNFAYYSSFFILGFIFSAFPGYENAMHRECLPSLIIGLTAMILMGFTPVWEIKKLGWALTGVAGYFMTIAMLGIGKKIFSFTNDHLLYLAESAYPVYVLHQFFIVMPGYYIIKTPLPIPVKFGALLAVSVLSTMAMYHYIVKRFRAARLLFGMKDRV